MISGVATSSPSKVSACIRSRELGFLCKPCLMISKALASSPRTLCSSAKMTRNCGSSRWVNSLAIKGVSSSRQLTLSLTAISCAATRAAARMTFLPPLLNDHRHVGADLVVGPNARGLCGARPILQSNPRRALQARVPPRAHLRTPYLLKPHNSSDLTLHAP